MNEYELLGISAEEWESVAEDNELYLRRATGSVKDEEQIIDEIIIKGGYNITTNEKRF